MNGIKYLLDTNIIIGVIKGNEQATSLVNGIKLYSCAFSVITRMELLGFSGITEHEERIFKVLLSKMERLSLNKDIEDATIKLRRQRRIKLPDAIIAATAITYNLELLTLDKDLSSKL